MADIPKWDGSPSSVSGSTPYGFYDLDADFQQDAPKTAIWVGRRLGYPITDVELQDLQMYAAFEEAITEYGAQVHQFNIRQNMLKSQGSSTSSALNSNPVNSSPVNSLIEIAEDYAAEVGAGGNIDWHRGFVKVVDGVQTYDLISHPSSSLNSSSPFYGGTSDTGDLHQPLSMSKGQSNIEIKQIYHNVTPASERYFYPFGGSGPTGNDLTSQFGFDDFGYSGYASTFILYPIYEDLLYIQETELSDEIRKSAYTFKLINNKLTVFPIPQGDFKLWFDYIEKSDRSNISGNSPTGVVSDYSNIPYNNLVYSQINDVGKQWIRKYTLALAKEMLGEIREKYSNIPSPGDQLQLNGPSLRSEAQTEKEMLIDQLRENLDETSRRKQMEAENDISEKMQNQLSRVPMKIYIG